MLTVIPTGRVTPKLRFTFDADLKGCKYHKRIISHPKTQKPLFQEVLGIDFANKGFESLSYNCKFYAGKKEISYKKFVTKTTRRAIEETARKAIKAN